MYQLLEQRLETVAASVPTQTLNYRGREAERIRSSQFNPPRWELDRPIGAMLSFYYGGEEVRWSIGKTVHIRNILCGELASPYHTQDGLSFLFVLRGEMTKMLMGRAVSFRAGDGCLVDAGCVHCELINPQDAMVFYLNLRGDFFVPEQYDPALETDRFLLDSRTEDSSLARYMLFRGATQRETLEKLFEQLLEEQLSAAPGYEQMQQGLVKRLFRLLPQCCETEIVESAASCEQEILFFVVDRYMRTHLATVSAAELEREFHFNRNYYNQLIRAQLGVTFSAHLKQLRLEEAKRLLAQTGDSVSHISSRVGYENRHFFYTLFRQETGLTPQEYRNQWKDKQG